MSLDYKKKNTANFLLCYLGGNFIFLKLYFFAFCILLCYQLPFLISLSFTFFKQCQPTVLHLNFSVYYLFLNHDNFISAWLLFNNKLRRGELLGVREVKPKMQVSSCPPQNHSLFLELVSAGLPVSLVPSHLRSSAFQWRTGSCRLFFRPPFFCLSIFFFKTKLAHCVTPVKWCLNSVYLLSRSLWLILFLVLW